jgi:hypothetical protein
MDAVRVAEGDTRRRGCLQGLPVYSCLVTLFKLYKFKS